MFIAPVHAVFETKAFRGVTVGAIIQVVFATPVQFWIGRIFYISAFKALRR